MTPFTSAEIQRENLREYRLGQTFPTSAQPREAPANFHQPWWMMVKGDVTNWPDCWALDDQSTQAARDRAMCETAHFGAEQSG